MFAREKKEISSARERTSILLSNLIAAALLWQTACLYAKAESPTGAASVGKNPASSAQASDLSRGIDFYNKGDMKSACQSLQQAVSSSARNNALAHYYFANALTATHRRAEARAQYEMVLRLAPQGQLADLARRGLLSVGGVPSQTQTGSASKSASDSDASSNGQPKRGYIGFQLTNGNEVEQIVPGSPAEKAGIQAGDTLVTIDGRPTTGLDERAVSAMTVGAARTDLNCEVERQGKRFRVTIKRAEKVDFSSLAGVRGVTAKTGDPLDASMITVLKQSGDSKKAYDEVLQGLSSIPHSVKEELSRSGVKIVVAPSITDARPELKGERPQGYVHGGTYENCPGMYTSDRNTLYIAERAQIGNDPASFNTRIPEVTLHELGHAYDYNKSLVSSTEFKEAYRQDCQHLSNTLRERYYYYVQDEGHELFAELFASANGSHDTPGLSRAFPRSFDFVRKSMR